MRLICPNCDAEYEVDAAAIPDTGRDVQCSSCGHAWFQLPPEIELALEQEDELFGAPVAGDAAAAAAVATAPAAEAAGDAPAAASPQMRTVDENLMAILREEAEREVQARKAEAAPIETQTEMGLAAPAAKGGLVGAARRIAQMKGIDPDAAPKPPPRPGSRRDMLPDIEEINSSLKGGEGLPPGLPELEPAERTVQGSGFRNGFVLSLLIAAVGVAAYVMAPRLGEQIPAVAAALDGYVGAVDAARLWLDGMMRAATAFLRDISGTDASGG
jgi:predicted Zn finger-like uncharacterized protein